VEPNNTLGAAQKKARLNKAKLGVVLMNLGTPDAPTPAALRKYLAEFLWDRRVVEIPRLLWWLILHAIILRVRPKKSAEAYQKVWTDKGSPLKVITQNQVLKLCERFDASEVEVEYAMRYGKPSVSTAIDCLLAKSCERILFLPLYPQYAASTVGSAFDAIAKDFYGRRALPAFSFVAGYHNDKAYIEAVADSIRAHWKQYGQADKLLMSFHGLPQYTHEKGDPYYSQCLESGRLIAQKLGLDDDRYLVVFQSRFGRTPWLQPYTDETLKSLPGQGVRSVQVVCPGFSADCLETLEEIDQENREYFISSGGQRYEYISALNDSEAHIEMMASLIRQHASQGVKS